VCCEHCFGTGVVQDCVFDMASFCNLCLCFAQLRSGHVYFGHSFFEFLFVGHPYLGRLCFKNSCFEHLFYGHAALHRLSGICVFGFSC
jgi:hypothetical protein